MTAVRRVAALALVGLVLVAGIVADRRTTPPAGGVVFGAAPAVEMPVAPVGDALTTSWYCPGVPAAADATGVVTVLNPSDQVLEGSLLFVPSEGASVRRPLQVAERTRVALRPAEVVEAPVVAVLVEVYGTNAVVEQTAQTPQGVSTSACATHAATTWYLADGATTLDATSDLVLFNPFPDDASVTLAFATEEGPRTPQALRNFVVPAQSVRVVDIDETVLRNTLVSTSVTVGQGRVVAGRLQTYNQRPRRGLVAGLASPWAGSAWWFANGRKGEGIAERVVVYNPGAEDAEVDITLFPADPAAGVVAPITVTLPPNSSTAVDIGANEEVPEGVHSILVTARTDTPIVAERSFELTGEARQATTSQFGSPLVASQWYSVTGAPGGGASTLTITNPTGNETSYTIFEIGPAGATPIEGASGVLLPGAGTVRVDLTAIGAADASLLVVSDDDGVLVVERFATPAADQPGASSWLGIPLAGS
jgi:hypothetical protein